MSERYGQYEQVNGGVANDALDQRDTAWAELREIREVINANAEESTADEVRRVVAQRDKLLEALKPLMLRKADIINRMFYGRPDTAKLTKDALESLERIIAEIEAAK